MGSDHAGVELKTEVKKLLEERSFSILDMGCWSSESVDYPEFGELVARWVAEEPGRLGILVCGTGIGMSMVANKVPGVRAALCHDPWTAQMTREHNNANVLCLGARVVGSGLALAVAGAFLDGQFAGGRHARRVEMMDRLDDGRAAGRGR